MKYDVIQIKGMSCHHCAAAVKKQLEKAGVASADVIVGQAKVSYDDTKITRAQLEKAIEEAGYEAA